MMVWLYLDHRGCVMSYNYGDMSGNTDWVYYDGALPSDNLTDDHGAAMYQLFDGVVLERPLSERMKDWPPEREPEPDYRNAFEQIAAILDGEAE